MGIQRCVSAIKGMLYKMPILRTIYNFLTRLFVPIRVLYVRNNYRRVVSRIQKRRSDEKIRVCFIVSEPTKWKCLLLYREMDASGVFYPFVALSAWNTQSGYTDDQLDAHFTNAEDFFNRLGVRHVRSVSTHPRVISTLREFLPDIVVFNEQWYPCGKQTATKISKFALTCFIPYYVPDYGDPVIDCMQLTEIYSHTYFVLNSEWLNLYRPYFKWWKTVARLVPAGHPALDYFSCKTTNSLPTDGFVIYAPHFSFPAQGHSFKMILTHGTFDWSGRAILQYAQQHPELRWAFKPHPLLKKELMATGFFTEREIEEYYRAWEKIGIGCYSGDYQELFMNSRAMITDCGSFLAEYGATGKPLIHLICGQNTATPPLPSKMLWDTYYKVNNLDEMLSVFQLVLEADQDPKRECRERMVEKLRLRGNEAAKNIVAYFRSLLDKQ